MKTNGCDCSSMNCVVSNMHGLLVKSLPSGYCCFRFKVAPSSYINIYKAAYRQIIYLNLVQFSAM